MNALDRKIAATIFNARSIRSLHGHADTLECAWERIRLVTHALHRLDDPERQLANAAAYLEAFGHVVVGWLWLDQAIVANTLASGPAGSDFHRGKLAACDYFFGWEMPKVAAWLAVLNPVETTPLTMPEHWF